MHRENSDIITQGLPSEMLSIQCTTYLCSQSGGYQHLGETYFSHLQASSLMMETLCSSETLITTYWITTMSSLRRP
jgi:hypothetical protein